MIYVKGTSSKLLSLQNNASNLKPSDIHILLNLFSVNYSTFRCYEVQLRIKVKSI
jgi:hypothetical protein